MATQQIVANTLGQTQRGTMRPEIGKRNGSLAAVAAQPAYGTEGTFGRPTPANPAAQREQLVVKLLPLVKRVASEVRDRLPSHVEVDDLVGAGVFGLIDAVRKFDETKDVKIETYARHRIRGAILDSLRSLDTASRDMRSKNKSTEKVYRRLEAELGRPVSDAEMAEGLGISLKKWYETVNELQAMGMEWLRPTLVIETPIPDENSLPAVDQPSQFDLCYEREQKEIMARAITMLPERERAVITMYYTQELTMKQIGEELGVDESRISQLHSAAVAHLKHRVQSIVRPLRPVTKLPQPSRPPRPLKKAA